jgi:hypothetical protein
MSTRDVAVHWEAQAAEQQRQQVSSWPAASQVKTAAGEFAAPPVDERKQSAAEACARVDERQRQMETRQHRAIDEIIAVRNSGEGGRSIRPAPVTAPRTGAVAHRAPPPHEAALAQPAEQPGCHPRIAPSLPAASAPAPASSSFFSSFASWFG